MTELGAFGQKREFKIAFMAQTSNRYVIIRHVIHLRFTLPLPFVAHVCTCRTLFRCLNFPQRFSRDSRLIYMFGKLILVKLVTSHCNLPFAVCTISGNLKLSKMRQGLSCRNGARNPFSDSFAEWCAIAVHTCRWLRS